MHGQTKIKLWNESRGKPFREMVATESRGKTILIQA